MQLERDDFMRVYHPLHLHFTSDYDAIKYGYKVKRLPKISDRSNDIRMRLVAGRFENPKSALKYCLANFAQGDTNWVYGDLQTSDEIYKSWQRRVTRLAETIKTDYEVFQAAKEKAGFTTADMLSKTKSGNSPPLLQMAIGGMVSKEFVCIMDTNLNFINTWRDTLHVDPLLKKELFILDKYKPFVTILKNEQEKK